MAAALQQVRDSSSSLPRKCSRVETSQKYMSNDTDTVAMSQAFAVKKPEMGISGR
jgi:hypothetical protein